MSNLNMRIGDVAKATGVGPATLRAWESRYGVLRPLRTEGGHRVYSAVDIARVRAVAALVDAGTRVSVVASRLTAPHDDQTVLAQSTLAFLWAAFDSFDEPAARATVREATDALGIPDALDLVFVPALRRLGVDWQDNPRNVAREHFASTMLRAHLVELLPSGQGPPTCLAFCPHGERHDLGLIMGALALGCAGWHTIVLGADTPSASIEMLIDEIRPSLLLIAASSRRPVTRLLERWNPPRHCSVIAGGPGFRDDDQEQLGGPIHNGTYVNLPATAATALKTPALPWASP